MSVDGLDRLDAIKARVQSDGRVRVVELASELDVSEMTIRRDLDLLAEQGVLQRVRGGARAVGPQPFAARYGQHARAKERIATKLLALVGDGGAIALDASTTVQRLARVMTDVRDITVLTNGPETFRSLQAAPGLTPLLTGGQLDRRTGSLVGPLAVRSAHDVLLRRVFVSAAGLDAVHGTTEATLEEADVKLALAAMAGEVVVAVDHTKLGQRGPARCLANERIHVLVTDLDPDDERLDPYRGGVRIL
jgi:DeoR family fructose operon transcriptional repressor